MFSPYRIADTAESKPRDRDRDLLVVLTIAWLTALAMVVASFAGDGNSGAEDAIAFLVVVFLPLLALRTRRA